VVYILFLVYYLGFRIDTACPYDMHMCKLKPKKKLPLSHTLKSWHDSWWVLFSLH
jgi:hypothetical protein